MEQRIPDVSQRRAVRLEHRSDERPDGSLVLHRARYGAARTLVAKAVRMPTETTVHLDSVAADAWQLMDGHRTVAEVRALLVDRWPAEPEVAERLGRLIGTLVSRRLLALR